MCRAGKLKSRVLNQLQALFGQKGIHLFTPRPYVKAKH